MTQSFDQIIDQISKMTALELSDLVKAIETTFGVSAALAVAAPAAAQEAAPAAAEKAELKVTLKEVGSDKIKVIKAIRSVLTTLSLTEAKQAVEGAPTILGESIPKEEAQKIKKALEEAGAKVELA